MQNRLALRLFLFAMSTAALGAAPRRAEAADPPAPSGPHPRMFMSPANLAGYMANVQTKGSSASKIVQRCQETIDNPQDYTDRGGADGDKWPGAAVSCAFAYQATQKAQYLTQAIKYWQASLNDDQDLGDNQGCVAGVSESWQNWDGDPPAPAVIRTVTHDTGYPIRWYGPYISLTYDWLYNAPGVTPALQAQTRTCLGNWIDYYTDRGYHHDEAGANYGAGYVASIAVGSVAIGTDGGADGHLWTQALDEVFQKLLIGQGLAGSKTGIGTPAGAMLGGDWAEGWQYGPFAVLNYAAATRVLEDNGAQLPEMDAWVNSLAVRYAYGTLPGLGGQYVGGDFDSDYDEDQVYQEPAENLVDAVLLGPSSDQAASWMTYMKQQQKLTGGDFIWNAIAELRVVPPQDYRAQTPAPPLWYLARGTRNVYARTAWDDKAFWSVFTSGPELVSDHDHFNASSFVFNRGDDGLIVDASNYGEFDTIASNAVSADSPGLKGDYARTQTPWSEADLPWVRGTEDAVYGARSDFAKGFKFADNPSDIPYAHREWTMLPEGEIVTIDRVHTADAGHKMYVQFHTHTAGSLALTGTVATGTAGNSKLVIHAAMLSGGTPALKQPTKGDDCINNNNYPAGGCDGSRFPVDEYAVQVPGPWAVAIHVIDGLGSGEEAAEVGSLNDDVFDPAPKQNTGVIGAAVYRGSKQSYVVASSAVDGASGETMSYGVPGASPARHIVYDAPEAADGSSAVTAAVQGDRCVISITKGAGGGLTGHPLMFSISAVGDACKVTESTAVDPGEPPPVGGSGGSSGSGQAGSGQAGSGEAGSAQAGSGQAGSGQAGSGQAGSGQAGSGQAGSGQAGSGQAGSGQAGSGQAGSGQAGSGNNGGAPAGGSAGTAGKGTAGSGQAGQSPAGGSGGTAGKGTAGGAGQSGGAAGKGGASAGSSGGAGKGTAGKGGAAGGAGGASGQGGTPAGEATPDDSSSGGCGCEMAGKETRSSSSVGLLLVGGLALARRRRGQKMAR